MEFTSGNLKTWESLTIISNVCILDQGGGRGKKNSDTEKGGGGWLVIFSMPHSQTFLINITKILFLWVYI